MNSFAKKMVVLQVLQIMPRTFFKRMPTTENHRSVDRFVNDVMVFFIVLFYCEKNGQVDKCVSSKKINIFICYFPVIHL